MAPQIPNEADSGARYAAPAAACAAELLMTLAERRTALSLTELARVTTRSKSLAFRVMRELERQGLVEKQPNGRYKLGITALLLGGAYVSSPQFSSSTDRALRNLADETGDNAYLAVLDGADVLVQAGYEGRNSIATASLVGRALPANCSAMGKALLARLPGRRLKKVFRDGLRGLTSQSITQLEHLEVELAATRNRGYAEEHGETHPALAGFAFAIRSHVIANSNLALLTDTRTAGVSEPGARPEGQMLALGLSMSIESDDGRRAHALEALRRFASRLAYETAILDAFGTASGTTPGK